MFIVSFTDDNTWFAFAASRKNLPSAVVQLRALADVNMGLEDFLSKCRYDEINTKTARVGTVLCDKPLAELLEARCSLISGESEEDDEVEKDE